MSSEKSAETRACQVTAIQRFCMHDGPGVRTTVFLKGCPLRCRWCHNPETQSAAWEFLLETERCIACGKCAGACPAGVHHPGERLPERSRCLRCGRCTEVCPTGALRAASRKMTVAEILDAIERDRAFYGTEGGVTLSGGEPFLDPDLALSLLSACRERGIGTCAETCGYFDGSVLPGLARVTDLLLWDVKDTDTERHRRNTGVGNEKILQNLAAADSLGIPTVLRCILVSGVNTDESHYRKLAELYHSLSHCRGIGLIPYHAYGGSKACLLGHEDNGVSEWIPSEEQVADAAKYLHARGVPILER